MSAHEDTSAPAQRRSRSLLGLPTRLAMLALGTVFLCTLGLTVWADRQLVSESGQHGKDEVLSVARAASAQFTSAEFAGGQFSPREVLEDRLGSVRKVHPHIAAASMFATPDGKPARELATDGKLSHASGAKADASEAASTGTQRYRQYTSGGSHVGVLSYPVVDAATRDRAGVLTFVYDYAALDDGLQRRQLRLYLAALVAASLLGFLLLSLLQRELFRPLLMMRSVMLQIRNGATGVRIGWSRGDELGLVAAEFDAMVEQLEAAHRELSQYVNRDPLTGMLNRQSFVDRLSGELTRARREGYPLTLVALDVDYLDEINRRFDRDTGDNVLRSIGEAVSMGVRPTDICGRVGGDEFQIALVGADVEQAVRVLGRLRHEIAQRVLVGPRRVGVTASMGVAEFPTHTTDQMELERRASSALAHAQKHGHGRCALYGEAGAYSWAEDQPAASGAADDQDAELTVRREPNGDDLVATVHALARAIDGRDGSSDAHSQHVAAFAVAIGRRMGMADADLQQLRTAAVLHDVGKVGVPDAILTRPASELDETEIAVLRNHANTARTVIGAAGLTDVALWVYHHPERYDGTGYPEGLSEEKIPLESRILHAANALDRMLTALPRRDAMTREQAAEDLKRHAGSQFDPAVVEHLVALIDGGNFDALLEHSDEADGDSGERKHAA